MSGASPYAAKLLQLRRILESGREVLSDHILKAELTSVLAANTTATEIIVTPYEAGAIVRLDGCAYASGGEAEADTMNNMHERFMGAKVAINGVPKTNDLYVSLFTLCRTGCGGRPVLWEVRDTSKISVTFKHRATAGVASLLAELEFAFVPFSMVG